MRIAYLIATLIIAVLIGSMLIPAPPTTARVLSLRSTTTDSTLPTATPLPLPTPIPSTIVIFGDGIAVGYGAFSQRAMWANQLQHTIDNRAVFGTTVAEQLNTQIIPYDGAATIAIWFSCTYDLYAATTAADYYAAIRGGVTRLQLRGMHVYLGTCLPPRSYAMMVGDAALHDAYNIALADVARASSATLVDINAVYDPQTMERDGMCAQPNDLGHAAIAKAFLAAFTTRTFLPIIAPSHPQTTSVGASKET